MKIKLKAVLPIIISIFLVAINTVVLASNLSVNVEFDGKKIEMTSETPEMEWKINNFTPGQSEEILLIINSIGSKEATVEFGIETIDENDAKENLIMKIVNNKTNEIAFEGKYLEFKNVSVKIPAKETNSFKIIVTFSKETEDEN